MSADTFLTVKVPTGEHEIKLRYIPEGIIPGLILTGLSIILSVVWLFPGKRHNRNVV